MALRLSPYSDVGPHKPDRQPYRPWPSWQRRYGYAINGVLMGWSQLTAINTAKALTIVLLLVLAAVIGVQDMRQVLYLSLHISYCLTSA